MSRFEKASSFVMLLITGFTANFIFLSKNLAKVRRNILHFSGIHLAQIKGSPGLFKAGTYASFERALGCPVKVDVAWILVGEINGHYA